MKIENEYGSYYTCDTKYKNDLRDLFISHLGSDVVYFTTGKLIKQIILEIYKKNNY